MEKENLLLQLRHYTCDGTNRLYGKEEARERNQQLNRESHEKEKATQNVNAVCVAHLSNRKILIA